MNLFIKQPLFWVATVLFLLVGVGCLTYLMPPLLSEFNSDRQHISQLNTDINAKQSYLDQVNLLKDSQAEIVTYFDSASKALPTTIESDVLLLELEGLVAEMGIPDATITVPFTQATSSAASSGGSVSAGGAANTTTSPVVKSDGSQTTFTINSKVGFAGLKNLLSRLRSFSRWNKITTIDISQSGGTYTTTVTAQVFWLSSSTNDFSGSTSFLSSAKTLLASLRSYTTVPDSTSEGSYGRSDPFAN